MGDRAACEAAYQKAADIANLLLASGIPVLGFMDLDMGASIGMAFQLDGERAKYACRLPLEKATPEAFQRLYEAVK